MNNIITLDNKYIEYYLGYKCNLNCSYCNLDKSDLSVSNGIDKFKNIIDNYKYFIDKKLMKIILSGGEPTLFKNEVMEILKTYSQQYTFHIISNGKNIDTLLEFCEYPIEVTISYDGHINDRGFDSFESIKKVHSTGRLKGINITISNSNYKYLYDTCKEIVENFPYLISEDLLSNNLTGLKMELVRQTKDFYNIDYDILKEQLKLIFKKISSKLHIFNTYHYICTNFWEYENHLITEHQTGMVSGKGCFQNTDNLNQIIENYEKYCTNCDCYTCYARRCPMTYDAIGDYNNHPYCFLNRAIKEAAEESRIEEFIDKQMRDLTYVELILTHNCNMNCNYCFENKNVNEVKVMDSKTVDILFDKLVFNSENKNILTLNLFGGEPIMNSTLSIRKYILEKLKQKRNRKIELTLVSNTYNVSENDLEWITEIKKYVEHFSWQVSLDSVKEYNDKNRIDIFNKGTFDKVIDNLKKISPIIGKENININSVITFDNIKGLPEWCIYLSDNILNKYANHFSFRIDQTRMTSMTLKERCMLSETFNSIVQLFFQNKIAPEVIRRVFNVNYETYFPFSSQRKLSCGICNKQISIDYNGDIIPCHYFDDEKLFMFNIKDFKKYNKNLIELYEQLSANTPHYNKSIHKKCDTCEFKYNCVRCKIEQLKNGDINVTSDFTCEWVHQVGTIYNKKLFDIFKPLTKDERVSFLNDLNEMYEIYNTLNENTKEYEEYLLLLNNMIKIRREKIW